ncbi:hypothetical protein [Gemelliphila palaticanis]|uniref:Uncharacterized protein n=1 Tax=Gemelliphila palaticanis TaxID=81950 RepID=A0ABX2T0W2_9BACL|nr:hypothetical protein [Gemella palaticanis]MBF0715348.1 hypothetical protein [Gemella palaticanis]NYS47278.1 hypothetical protein [Gemella palaticanis]
MNNYILDEIKQLQRTSENKKNSLSLDTKRSVNSAKRVATVDEFSSHKQYIALLIEEELDQKMQFRKYCLYATGILLGLFFILLIILYVYLLLYKGYEPSDKVLITLSVTVFSSILGLVTIVFKYLFSNTKDTTDYIHKFILKDREKN